MAFDLVVNKRDKHGKVITQNDYILKVENGVKQFERPPKSGQWFYEDGSPVKKDVEVKKEEKMMSKESFNKEQVETEQKEDSRKVSTKK